MRMFTIALLITVKKWKVMETTHRLLFWNVYLGPEVPEWAELEQNLATLTSTRRAMSKQRIEKMEKALFFLISHTLSSRERLWFTKQCWETQMGLSLASDAMESIWDITESHHSLHKQVVPPQCLRIGAEVLPWSYHIPSCSMAKSMAKKGIKSMVISEQS